MATNTAAWPSPVIVVVRSVPQIVSTVAGMMVPSWLRGPRGAPTRDGASRSCCRISRSEARANGAEAMVAHLKLMVAKLEQHRYGASSERGRKLLEKAELQLEELETDAAEEAIATEVNAAQAGSVVRSFRRRKPVRG